MPRIHPNHEAHRRLNWWALCLSWAAEKSSWSQGWFWGLGIATSTLVTLIQLCDPKDQPFPQPWQDITTWVYGHRLVLTAALLFLQVLSFVAVVTSRKFLPFDQRKVGEILEAALLHHFPDQDPSKFLYRATLFKIRKFPFLGMWLGIVCRSGLNFRQSNTVFSLSRMNQLQCTGVAGECAWQNSAITIGPLDPLAQGYVDSGWVAVSEHEAFNVRAVVFFAIPVRKQDGEQWGVLVLDTTDENYAPGPPKSDRSPKKLETDLSHFALALKTAIRD